MVGIMASLVAWAASYQGQIGPISDEDNDGVWGTEQWGYKVHRDRLYGGGGREATV